MQTKQDQSAKTMQMRQTAQVLHPIAPTYDAHSRILILGSFPSVKSREMGYFYGHPQNRFWKVLSNVCADGLPCSIEERRAFLLRHHIALWDVIASCTITGSSDSSIRDVRVNDLSRILREADIRRIYVNGKKAEQLYKRHTYEQTQIQAVVLPSTSPANAAWSLEKLIHSWSQIREWL